METLPVFQIEGLQIDNAWRQEFKLRLSDCRQIAPISQTYLYSTRIDPPFTQCLFSVEGGFFQCSVAIWRFWHSAKGVLARKKAPYWARWHAPVLTPGGINWRAPRFQWRQIWKEAAMASDKVWARRAQHTILAILWLVSSDTVGCNLTPGSYCILPALLQMPSSSLNNKRSFIATDSPIPYRSQLVKDQDIQKHKLPISLPRTSPNVAHFVAVYKDHSNKLCIRTSRQSNGPYREVENWNKLSLTWIYLPSQTSVEIYMYHESIRH